MLAIRAADGYPDAIGAVIREGPGTGGEYRIIVGCGQDTGRLAAGAGRLGGVLPGARPAQDVAAAASQGSVMVRIIVRMTRLGTCDVFKARRVTGRPGL